MDPAITVWNKGAAAGVNPGADPAEGAPMGTVGDVPTTVEEGATTGVEVDGPAPPELGAMEETIAAVTALVAMWTGSIVKKHLGFLLTFSKNQVTFLGKFVFFSFRNNY